MAQKLAGSRASAEYSANEKLQMVENIMKIQKQAHAHNIDKPKAKVEKVAITA